MPRRPTRKPPTARAVNYPSPRRSARKVREGREPTVSTTIRLRRSLRDQLEGLAERKRRSVADVMQQLLEEALRIQECPGIYFADEPAGRVAKVGGTGLGVWEVLRDFVKDRDHERLRRAFHWLSPAQIAAALRYYERYRDEVRLKVEANAAIRPEELVKQFPGRYRIVRVR